MAKNTTAPLCASCSLFVQQAEAQIRELRALVGQLAKVASLPRTSPALTLRALYDAHRERASEGGRSNLDAFARNQGATLLDVPVAELDAMRVSKWVAGMRGKIKESTARQRWKALRCIVRAGIALGLVEAEPWGAFSPRFDVDALQPREATRSADELARLLQAARGYDAEQRREGRYSDVHAKIAVAVALALRNGEIGGLGWDDVRWTSPATITIRHQARERWKKRHPDWARPLDPPKTRESAILTLAPWLVRVLEEHREYLGARGWYRPDGPIFPEVRHGGWRTDPQSIPRYMLARLARAAGLPGKWTPHSTRDSGCSLEMFAKRGDLRSVQVRTRHKSERSLYRYLHAATRAAVEPGIILADGSNRSDAPKK